jgi:hypothetical protein
MLERALGSAFDASAQQWFLRVWREGIAPETLDELFGAQVWNMDLRELLPKVSLPTLVVHYRNNASIPFEAGRELAAGIPGALFVPLEGDAHVFYFGDTRPLRRAMAEFLGDPIEEVGWHSTDAAKVPSAPEVVEGISSKEGEFWTIACRGEVFRLRGLRGLVPSVLMVPSKRRMVAADRFGPRERRRRAFCSAIRSLSILAAGALRAAVFRSSLSPGAKACASHKGSGRATHSARAHLVSGRHR